MTIPIHPPESVIERARFIGVRNCLRDEGLRMYREMLAADTIQLYGFKHNENGFWVVTPEDAEPILDQIVDALNERRQPPGAAIF